MALYLENMIRAKERGRGWPYLNLTLCICAVLFTGEYRIGLAPESQHASSAGGNTTPAVAPEPVTKQSQNEKSGNFTQLTAYHVIFHERSGIRVRAEWLHGRLYPTDPRVVPSLDDPKSFKLIIDSGVTQISLQDVSQALTSAEFHHSHLSKIHVIPHGTRDIQINAVLRGVVPVHLFGEIGATNSERIEIRIKKIKLLHIPFTGLLKAFDLSPSQLAAIKNSKAIQIQGNSLFISTADLLPAPRKLGKITDVHFTGDGQLEERYGDDALKGAPPPGRRIQNYMRLLGGSIRFGKLMMYDTDLTLTDTSPGDWFEFDAAHYLHQLAAGNMRMTEDGGLQVFTPDSTKIPWGRLREAPAGEMTSSVPR